MKYGSVCSGIEAASVAWHQLGWKASFLSEIEKFPRAVLEHHYPSVPLHGDFTTITKDDYEPIDLLVGGTPCQDFSVAGLRAGIIGERGSLTLEFVSLADRLKPRWIVWENVPGVLSSDGGRALGAFLGALEELGYGWAYRTLDAQYFGVAQRRRRVFVVGYLGDWRRAAAVLFERESVSGNPAPSREAGQRIAPCVTNGPPFSRTGNERVEAEAMIVQEAISSGTDPHTMATLCATDAAKWGSNQWVKEGKAVLHPVNIYGGNKRPDRPEGGFYVRMDEDTSKTLDSATGLNPTCSQGGTAVMQVVGSLSCNTGPNGHDAGNFACNQSVDAGHLVPVAFTQNQRDEVRKLDVAGALSAKPGMKQQTYLAQYIGGGFPGTDEACSGYVQPAYALQGNMIGRADTAGPQGSGIGEDISFTLTKADQHAVAQEMAVRRLTPVECERLQGFPDGYTNIPWRGKAESPDGPRYKALGNSMAVPVMRWIGEHIEFIDMLS